MKIISNKFSFWFEYIVKHKFVHIKSISMKTEVQKECHIYIRLRRLRWLKRLSRFKKVEKKNHRIQKLRTLNTEASRLVKTLLEYIVHPQRSIYSVIKFKLLAA